jgi:hypothetical protein
MYGYAKVGRFGLGHALLAWARCVVWCEQNSVQSVFPSWYQPRIGPALRKEFDKRQYYRLFHSEGQLGGLKRLVVLARWQRVPIQVCDGEVASDTVIEFTNRMSGNEATHFHEIVGHHALVRSSLKAMTKKKFHPPASLGFHIAIHVRGGDFGVAPDLDALRKGATNSRLPIHWYVDMITALRTHLGKSTSVIVYSDCTNEELAPVLALSDTKRAPKAESITDMLAMSQANVLVSSGSGFSRWGSYLGQVPRLCFPGQRGVRVLGEPIDLLDLEPEAETAADIPPRFLKAITKKKAAV